MASEKLHKKRVIDNLVTRNTRARWITNVASSSSTIVTMIQTSTHQQQQDNNSLPL